MASFEILESGRLDERESAFPQAIELPNGDVLCAFSVGGGQYVHGGTDWARSRDGGRTWTLEGCILPPSTEPVSSNALKLSLAADARSIQAYGARYWANGDERFGDRRCEAAWCESIDGGRSWSPPKPVPFPACPLEISHSLRPLASGRWLAPAATLADPARLGERVVVAVSDDRGRSWPALREVFHDPAGQFGFWEQKLIEVRPGCILALAWTVSLGDYRDQCNSYSFSRDDGWTWSEFRSTGLRGQTMSATPLGGDRLAVFYNRRYGRQGVVLALVECRDETWRVLDEGLVFDARADRAAPGAGTTGVDELAHLQFGFPTAIALRDGTLLATHWSVESGRCGIRWTKLRVEWP